MLTVGISDWQPKEVPRNNLKLTVVGEGTLSSKCRC